MFDKKMLLKITEQPNGSSYRTVSSLPTKIPERGEEEDATRHASRSSKSFYWVGLLLWQVSAAPRNTHFKLNFAFLLNALLAFLPPRAGACLLRPPVLMWRSDPAVSGG